ncbi:MAG: hypothetical protein EAX86_03575 [Candidatus Heimdallarchaeota archaeon]|nr:hypothetical protein [Candidatus Heimdallarchaeota archaeon]
MNRRLIISTGLGVILGILCIIGIGLRIGYQGNEIFLFAMWYNRVIMGLMIGFASDLTFAKNYSNVIIRGAILGLLVTSAIFFTSEFRDILSFFAGIAYGVIIDIVATRYSFEKSGEE